MAEEVVQAIQWTDSAKITFQKTIEYLQQAWGEKEVAKFVNRTEEMLSTLKRYPEMCRPSMKRKMFVLAY